MGIMIDYAPSVAELMARDVVYNTLDTKRAAAIKWLGRRYVCHKSNRIKKLVEPLPINFVRPNGGGK